MTVLKRGSVTFYRAMGLEDGGRAPSICLATTY